jgi:hypothetical protein
VYLSYLLFPSIVVGLGDCITKIVLGGSFACIHCSSVGKYGIWLYSVRLFISLHFRWKVGQLLSQMVCPSVPQGIHHGLDWLVHSEVRWLCTHVPHVSCSLVHLDVRWFHLWHLRHLIGSFLHFSAYTFFWQINRPLASISLVARADDSERIRCPHVCVGLRLVIGLIQNPQDHTINNNIKQCLPSLLSTLS